MATTVQIGTFFQEDPVISADGRFVVLDDYPQVLVRELATGELSIVSVSSEEEVGNRTSGLIDAAAISADGRYIAFTSDATNLVPNDTNGERDLFLRDTIEGTTRLISLDNNGNQIPANTFDSQLRPSISADGRFVAFQTEAPFGGGPDQDIFVRDVVANTSELISVNSEGVPADSVSFAPSISADGRYVAFFSLADNLVAEDPLSIDYDVFVRDRQNQTTIRASVNSQGQEGSGVSENEIPDSSEATNPVMSPDGSYVVFQSGFTNLVPNDTNGFDDIFQHDLETGETKRISVDSNGNQANGGSGLGFNKSAVSADGRYIVFQSGANNLVEGDTNNATDVFVRDTVEETTTRVSVNADGEEPVGGFLGTKSVGGTISGDGRYIVFMSNGNNMNDEGIDTDLIYLRDTGESTDEVPDEIPTVVNPITDITVEEDAENQTIDLSDVFRDADGDEITIAVQSNNNPELVSAIIEDNNLTLDFQEERTGTAEITLRATANGQSVDEIFTVTVDSDEPNKPNEPDELSDTIELFRFRNTSFTTGTYVFVGETEREAILADENLSNTFSLDGRNSDGTVNPAFTASLTPKDDLLSFFRLKSLDILGTFLFVSTEEYNAIFAENSDQRNKWEQESFDNEGNDIPEFYLLPPGVGSGVPFNRYQNTENSTFLYAGAEESNVIDNNPDLANIFTSQGAAFNSLM
jgi:Tol biopolymer transport system component